MFFKLPLVPLIGSIVITHLLPDAYALHGFDPCPAPCSVSGFHPVNWTAYSHLSRLNECDKTVMVDFSIHAPVDKSQRVRSCAIWGSDFENIAVAAGTPNELIQPYTTTARPVDLELAWWNGGDGSESRSDAVDAALTMNEVQSYLTHADRGSNNRIMLFAASGNVAVGIYVGEAVINRDIANAVVLPLIDQIIKSGLSKGAFAQVCGTNRTNQDTVGIIAATDNNFALVQTALRTWSEAKCVEGADRSVRIPNTTISTAHALSNATSHYNGTYAPTELHRRGDCRTLSVELNDSCSKLASRCGISLAQFQKYNPGDNFCPSLQPKQKVCCTSGTIPTPKQNSDGSCASYRTADGDTCSGLAYSNGITTDDIEKFNKNTWGWAGCDPSKFWADMNICLSSGTPPMPVTIDNANCGPQVAGTKRPPAGTSLASLNPCPLNVCCDIWGQCGTTDEFCDPDGPNKCVSNCGKDIIKGSAPSSRMTVAYFEGFNLQRDCLNMDISQVDPKAYTHIHFAFGLITNDFKVSLGNAETTAEFNQFKLISGPKKILSFGGWDFSTKPSTYMIFREGTTATHRQTLANNLANFIKDNDMDGIDIDWEYPSAPDIPGIPPGDKAEGLNLLKFLKLLKDLLPGKSVSIAAPASYWYLKGIPIKEISKVVDYIVYMTYDLHGQWDYGNQWSDPGCPTGNCLRSDVNMTETLNALVMITKAGVPANKVVVGVTSYGRSFEMTSPGCTAESCTYTGSASGATPGRCTKEPGYLGGAEIDEILSTNPSASTFFDKGSQTDVLVYNTTQWASYMTKRTKDDRIQKYNSYNFLGSSDWAIDLADFHAPPGVSDSNGGSFGLELTWDMFKANIKNSGIGTCDKAYRTGTWVSKPCTIDVVADVLSEVPKRRWEKMDCDHAWSDMITRWFACDSPSNNGTFSYSASNFLHADELAHCDDLAFDTNCDSVEQCDAHNGPDDPDNAKTGACAYEIWNSLVAIHEIIHNFHATANIARQRVLERKDDFLKTFGNPPAGNLGPLFQVINPIVSLVGGWFIKGALADKPAFEKSGSYVESSSLTALNMLMSFVPGLMPKPEDFAKLAWADCMNATFATWDKSSDALVVHLFRGKESGVKDLTLLIADGAMIEGSANGTYDPDASSNYTQSFLDEGLAERAFFGASIPIIWGVMGDNPVVLMTDYDCGTNNPLSPQYIDEITGPETWVCLPGKNKMYYLVEAYGRTEDDCTQFQNGESRCVYNTFRAPRGLDKLDGKTWGGLTRDDLVVGAVNTYEANGGNKKDTIDFQNKRTLQRIVESDIRAPGVINIPVCTAKEAYANWVKGKKDSGAKFYPCN